MKSYEPIEDNAGISRGLPALLLIATLAKFLKVMDSSTGILVIISNLSSVINI